MFHHALHVEVFNADGAGLAWPGLAHERIGNVVQVVLAHAPLAGKAARKSFAR